MEMNLRGETGRRGVLGGRMVDGKGVFKDWAVRNITFMFILSGLAWTPVIRSESRPFMYTC